MAARREAAKTGGFNLSLELGGGIILLPVHHPLCLRWMSWAGHWGNSSLGSVFCPLGSSLNHSPESPLSRLLGDSRVQG